MHEPVTSLGRSTDSTGPTDSGLKGIHGLPELKSPEGRPASGRAFSGSGTTSGFSLSVPLLHPLCPPNILPPHVSLHGMLLQLLTARPRPHLTTAQNTGFPQSSIQSGSHGHRGASRCGRGAEVLSGSGLSPTWGPGRASLLL